MATSPALAYSLSHGISQEQFDKSIVDAIKLGESKGLSDAQFESLMNQYQISAADVARATQSTPAAIQARMEAAKPTTQTEIDYDRVAMAELAARQAQNQTQIAANQKAYEEQQRLNALASAEQQRLNALASAEQQRLNALKNQQQIAANQKAYQDYLANQAKLAAEQATKTTGTTTGGLLGPTGNMSITGTTPFANATQGFAQNFANYQSIPIGAQYNPNVVGGVGSPYSQVMAQMRPVGNPYAGVVAGQAMGGYNPGLYDQIAAANLANTEAAAAAAAADPGQISDGLAHGGMVHSGLMFGGNPPGPDDGAVNLDMGEYVIKKSSVNKYGRGLLDMINEGKVPAKKMKSLLG